MSASAAYLTQTQLNFLSSDCPAAEKVHYAADVMVRMGLVMPSEPTSGHVVATIRELGAAELADGNHFLSAVQELKRSVKSASKTVRHAWHLETWPDNPDDLPKEIKSIVWKEEKPVGAAQSPAVGLPPAGPVRKTSRQVLPASTATSQPQTLQGMMQMFAAAAAGMLNAPSTRAPIQYLPQTRATIPLALGDRQPQEAPAPAAGHPGSPGLEDGPSPGPFIRPTTPTMPNTSPAPSPPASSSRDKERLDPASQARIMLDSWKSKSDSQEAADGSVPADKPKASAKGKAAMKKPSAKSQAAAKPCAKPQRPSQAPSQRLRWRFASQRQKPSQPTRGGSGRWRSVPKWQAGQRTSVCAKVPTDAPSADGSRGVLLLAISLEGILSMFAS